ncbi:hypothetical protein, partial [Cupriavidus sp. YAF13]|uniref:hypothetical protein n=1 Tax=Cupriavidus sp. YAF13 TaxID=3233075 RepID=UPI003F9041BE
RPGLPGLARLPGLSFGRRTGGRRGGHGRRARRPVDRLDSGLGWRGGGLGRGAAGIGFPIRRQRFGGALC